MEGDIGFDSSHRPLAVVFMKACEARRAHIQGFRLPAILLQRRAADPVHVPRLGWNGTTAGELPPYLERSGEELVSNGRAWKVHTGSAAPQQTNQTAPSSKARPDVIEAVNATLHLWPTVDATPVVWGPESSKSHQLASLR
jgi:hypothetical protein